MKLHQLQYFVVVCECGSYTRAAAQLYVAQPSLSQQIRALEEDLGARLLDRVPEGVRLTAAGQVLLPEARAILAVASRARTAVRDVAAGVGRELTVMSVRSVATHLLPTALAAWHNSDPDPPLKLRDFHHRRLLHAAMAAGEGDVGIGPRPENWPGPVVGLGYEQFVLVAALREQLPLGPNDLASLSGQGWVLFEEANGLTEISDAFCRRYGIEPRVAVRCAQVEAALALALDGVGVSLLPLNAIPLHLRHVHTARAGHGVFRELVAYSARQTSTRATAFLHLLRELDLQLVGLDDIDPGAMLC